MSQSGFQSIEQRASLLSGERGLGSALQGAGWVLHGTGMEEGRKKPCSRSPRGAWGKGRGSWRLLAFVFWGLLGGCDLYAEYEIGCEDGSGVMVRCEELRGGGSGGASVAAGGSGGSGGGSGLEKPLEGDGPSCAGGLDCGGVSCCESRELPGGSFNMGRSGVSSASDYYSSGKSDEIPEHSAMISSFALDKFEVTVGRFRKFVAAYPDAMPTPGSGAHPLISNSGWQSFWDSSLPASQAQLISNLKCYPGFETWTDVAGSNENYPINCVNWYEAFAFCAWDGGRLPTEAEWEYAASGGEDRLYPWGSTSPSGNVANYSGAGNSPYIAVGSVPAGNGKFGHADMAGSMWEWGLDGYDGSWYSGGGSSCTNCANQSVASYRVLRGGSFLDPVSYMRAASRGNNHPAYHLDYYGFRCARAAR